MTAFSFGEYTSETNYKVVNERVMRGASGIMLLLGFIAFINGFIIKNYIALPYISGFIVLNFFIGIVINPKFSPIVFVSWLLVKKQKPLLIGAIQKQFAWGLGLTLTTTIFILSLLLLKDVSYFEPVCMLCLICILFLFLETAFGICIGCKIYHLFLKTKLLKAPKYKPNCMGDSCDTNI